MRNAYHADVPAKDNVKPFTPQVTLSTPRVSQVAFSSDESCLVITAEEGGGIAVYDVDSLLNGNQQSAFQMPTEGTAVRALLPNPAADFSHLFAVVLANGQLKIQANNPEQEEAEEEVGVEYNGGSLEIGFNVSYLLDVLGVMTTEQVRLILSDSNSSALVQESDNDDSAYVVMPMRL